MNSPYFAVKSPEECVRDCLSRVDDYYMFMDTSGQWTRLRNSYQAYNRPGLNLGENLRHGSVGQYMDVSVNNYRNLIEHAVGQVVTQRVTYAPKAMNTDYKSQAQTILAKGLLEYYNRINNMDQLGYRIVRDGFLFGESYLYLRWDATKGDPLTTDPETGHVYKEGDLSFSVFNSVDVVRDCRNPFNQEPNWYILVERVNKHDLASQYPHLADKILGYTDEDRKIAFRYVFNQNLWSFNWSNSDYVVKYTFLHKKTPSLPEGRIIEFLGDDCVLFDAPLPYDELPVHRFFVSEWESSPFAYTHAWDLLPLQDNLDRLYSAVTSNNAAFAIQSVLIPEGAQISEESVGQGLLAIKYRGALKPEALQLTASAPETYQLIAQYQRQMEILMAVGSIARNDPEAFKTSGSALALLQSISAQFNQQIQNHYIFFLERLGTNIIKILQQNSNNKRVAVITGKNNRQYLKEFSNSDIDAIQRVYVEMGNPVMQTIAGNYELATTLVNQQVITSVDQLLEVLSTGRIEPLYEGEQAELMLIRSENEKLGNSEPQPVLITDNHSLHIQEHKSILANPEDRQNPQLIQAVLDHIQQHMDFESMLNQPVVDPAAQGQNMELPVSPIETKGPSMPTNPATGMKFNPKA